MDDDVGGDRGITRRRLLEASGLAGAASLVGCQALSGGDSVDTVPGTRTVRTVGTVSSDDGDAPTVTADGDRVAETLESLSLSEKIGQMTLLEPRGQGGPFGSERLTTALTDYQIGGILFGGANAPGASAAEAAEYFNRAQSTAVDEMGVPLLTGIDAVHGNATVREAAVFPHQVGLGATWNTDLAAEIAARTARSLSSIGVNWTYSPVADVAYDPRWGRYFECFSEDPHVTGAFTRAMVRGYEQPVDSAKRVAASVKHFAGYSVPETGQDRDPADVSRRTLQDVHLPPFEAGVQAGTETVMANSGSVNGVPAHVSEWLLTTVLRDQWGFDGLLVSDWQDLHRLISLHEYASSFEEAVELAITAGVDVYMAPHESQIDQFQPALETLVEEGRVPEDRIDEAVRRIVRVKDRLGLFDDAVVPVDQHTESVVPADRELARRAAAESLTLLRNDSVLPLDDVESVLVTGPTADDVTRQLGGWTTGWQGVAFAEGAPETTTIREGIGSVAPDGVNVTFLETSDTSLTDEEAETLTDAASDADVVVAGIGEGAYAEGSGDITDLRLPQGQRDLISTLAATDADTVGVVIAGRPRGSPELFSDLDATLMAYYPGSEGGTAIAQALFGEVAPAGRLPFTWPRSAGDIPDVVGARPPADGTDELAVQFPFGAGESYPPVHLTEFALSQSTVADATGVEEVGAAVDVVNGGDVATDHVVTVVADYNNNAAVSDSPVIPPARRVVGFERVHVEAGSTTSVTVPLSLEALAVTGGDVTGGGERVVPAGEYALSAGSESVTLTVESTESV